MSSPQARDVAITPGRLVADPTSLAAAYPYGGTELGVCRDKVFRPGMRYRPIHAEEWGVSADAVLARQSAVFGAVLRSWDDDLLAQMFPNATTGASGHALIECKPGVAGQTQPGVLLSTLAVKLLFVPDAAATGSCVLLYQALPMVDEAAAIEFGANAEAALAVMWEASIDTTGRCYQVGRLEDLTL